MVWLRSFVFQVYFFASVCLAALTIFVGFFLPYRVRFGIARLWARSMLAAGKLLCGMDYVFEGCENIPAVPSVVMMKHTTVLRLMRSWSHFRRKPGSLNASFCGFHFSAGALRR